MVRGGAWAAVIVTIGTSDCGAGAQRPHSTRPAARDGPICARESASAVKVAIRFPAIVANALRKPPRNSHEVCGSATALRWPVRAGLRRVERLRQVRDQVIGRLDADRQPDQRGVDGERRTPRPTGGSSRPGTSISDSTPPSDSASVNRRVDSQTAIARSAAVRPCGPPGRRHERDHAPERRLVAEPHLAARPPRPRMRVRRRRRAPGSAPTRRRRAPRGTARPPGAFARVALHPQARGSAARAARGSSRTAPARRPSRSGGTAAGRRPRRRT